MIRTTDLSFGYSSTQTILHNINISVPRGRTIGLVGPNGSGKSTLLRCLTRALKPKSGTITLEGHPAEQLSLKDYAKYISVVVQETTSSPDFTVMESVALGRSPHMGTFQKYSDYDHEAAADAIDKVGLSHKINDPFTGLSGGEKQRALIARAVCQEAEYLLLDEPTNHLDVRFQHEILSLITSLGKSCLVVLHDLNLAARYCDFLYLMMDGKIQEEGTPTELFDSKIIDDVYGLTTEYISASDGVEQFLFRTANPVFDGKERIKASHYG